MKSERRAVGIHVIDTEVRDFDEALRILDEQQKQKQRVQTRRAKRIVLGKPAVTVRQECALALQQTRVKLGLVKQTRREKLPHPLKDLSPEAKATKVREMYDHGNGHWGWGDFAFRRLAKAFDVPLGQIVTWLNEPRRRGNQ